MTFKSEVENLKKQPWLVKGKDPFLSGWGQAEGGASWCAWAFSDIEAAQAFERLLRRIGQYQYIGLVKWPYKPRNAAHFHVYDGDKRITQIPRPYGHHLAVQYGDHLEKFRVVSTQE